MRPAEKKPGKPTSGVKPSGMWEGRQERSQTQNSRMNRRHTMARANLWLNPATCGGIPWSSGAEPCFHQCVQLFHLHMGLPVSITEIAC